MKGRSRGYAIVHSDGNIDVRTVMPNPRGAKINWLMVARGAVVYNHWTDNYIDEMFSNYSSGTGLTCCEIEISVVRRG